MPRCIYCNETEEQKFKSKVHVLSQFMGNFEPDLYFKGDIVCDGCNTKFGNTFERHFANKSFEGLLSRLMLRKKKQSPVITFDSDLLKFNFHPDTKVDFDPIFLLIQSCLDRIANKPDPLLLFKKDNRYALVFADRVVNASKSDLKKLKKKLDSFKGGSAEYIGDKDNSRKIVIDAMTKLGLKANYSDEKVNDNPKQINTKFFAIQDVDRQTARLVAKVALEYFVYCLLKSNTSNHAYSDNFSAIKNFISKDEGLAGQLVKITSNNLVASKLKQGNQHYFVSFKIHRGVIIGQVAFMDSVGYAVKLGNSPFVLANERIGNGHAFNLHQRRTVRMYRGIAPTLGTSEFSIYNN